MSKSNYRTAAQINLEQRIKRLENRIATTASAINPISTDQLFEMFKNQLISEHGLEGIAKDWSGIKFNYKGSIVTL